MNWHFFSSIVSTAAHCIGYLFLYSEAVQSLYHRELNSFYCCDDNTSLEIVTRLTYTAADNIATKFGGYTQSPTGIWRRDCGTNSGYLSYLATDDKNGCAVYFISTNGFMHLFQFLAGEVEEEASNEAVVCGLRCSGCGRTLIEQKTCILFCRSHHWGWDASMLARSIPSPPNIEIILPFIGKFHSGFFKKNYNLKSNMSLYL